MRRIGNSCEISKLRIWSNVSNKHLFRYQHGLHKSFVNVDKKDVRYGRLRKFYEGFGVASALTKKICSGATETVLSKGKLKLIGTYNYKFNLNQGCWHHFSSFLFDDALIPIIIIVLSSWRKFVQIFELCVADKFWSYFTIMFVFLKNICRAPYRMHKLLHFHQHQHLGKQFHQILRIPVETIRWWGMRQKKL